MDNADDLKHIMTTIPQKDKATSSTLRQPVQKTRKRKSSKQADAATTEERKQTRTKINKVPNNHTVL